MNAKTFAFPTAGFTACDVGHQREVTSEKSSKIMPPSNVMTLLHF